MKIVLEARGRLLLLVTVVLLILGAGAGVYEYRRYSRERERQAWKADGMAAARAGQTARAIELLTRYLHVQSEDAEALRCYALVRQEAALSGDQRAIADTITVLQLLSEQGQLRDDERRRLMELYTRAGNDTRAALEADILLKKFPADPSILQARTQALIRQHKWREASEVALVWCDAAPLDVAGQYSVLFVMQQQQATPKEIVGRAVTLRRAHLDDARFELLESLALTLTHQQAEPTDISGGTTLPSSRTPADWARLAASHAALDAELTRILVDQLNRLGLFDESLGILQKRVANSTDPQARRALARRLWEARDWASLARLLSSSVSPDAAPDAETLYQYGDALAHLGRATEVAPIRAALAQRTADPLAAAWLSVLDQLAGVPPLPAQQALTCYSGGVSSDPQNPYCHFLLADALERLGETDLAIDQLRMASLLSATWAAPAARLSDLLLSHGRSSDAFSVALQALARLTRNGQVHDIAVTITVCRAWAAAIDNGQTTDEASLKKLLTQVQQVAPGEEQTLGMQVALLVHDKDIGNASKLLTEAIRSPRALSEPTLLRYAAISEGAGLGLETECFDRSERDHGITSELCYARALRVRAAGHPDQGLAMLNSCASRPASATAPANPLNWRVAQARYLQLIGDPGAKTALRDLGDAYPDVLGVQQMIVNSAAARRDRQLIQRAIERLHKLTGDQCLQWRLAHARWMLDNPDANPEDARAVSEALSSVLSECPDCPEGRLLLASSLQRLHETDAAIRQLQAAVRLLPDSVEVAMQFAQLLESRGDFSEAGALLKRFTQGPLSNPAALVMAGWLQEHDGLSDAAEKSYRAALRLQPDFMPAQNNLAALLVKEGHAEQLKEAMDLATRASKTSPNSAAVFDTLSSVQAKAHDYDAAASSIGRAVALATDEPDYRIHQIELQVESGHRDVARKLLAELETARSKSSANRPESNSAEQRTLEERLHSLHRSLNPDG